jgi:hypothetical protein
VVLAGLVGSSEVFTGPGGEVTLDLDYRAEYVYDVLNQLVGMRHYKGDATTPSEIEGYVVERGNRVIEFEHTLSGGFSVLGRLNGVGVDQLLAVDRAGYNADWQPIGVQRTTWVPTDHQGTVRDLAGEARGFS